MNAEIDLALKKLSDAMERLREGAAQASDALEKDGVIQRFEFTFELLWKTLRIFLEDEGVICKSPRECLKSAFKMGLIQDERAFLDMLEDRNLTSHIYDQSESERIFQNIKQSHLRNLVILVGRITEAVGKAGH